MPELQVSIVRFVDETQPGVVACEFTDANHRVNTLIDKIAIFSNLYLWKDSQYPQPGLVHCEILEELRDESGRELLGIKFGRPDESVEGETEFIAQRSQIQDCLTV